MFNLKTAATVFAVASALTATVATARTANEASPDAVRIVVRYGDLNLATREGADALRSRVVHAAMQIKGNVDPRDLQGMAEMRKARDAALAMADAIIVHSQPAFAATGGAPDHLDL
jgi:UrcA family protein